MGKVESGCTKDFVLNWFSRQKLTKKGTQRSMHETILMKGNRCLGLRISNENVLKLDQTTLLLKNLLLT